MNTNLPHMATFCGKRRYMKNMGKYFVQIYKQTMIYQLKACEINPGAYFVEYMVYSMMDARYIRNRLIFTLPWRGDTIARWLLFVGPQERKYEGTVTAHNNLSGNTLKSIQNGSRFADDIFKCIFLNENLIIFHWIMCLGVKLTMCHHWFI